MISTKVIFIVLTVFYSYIIGTYSLDCYVCDRQDANTEKCLKTTMTCEQGEDVCLSEISWGSTPYWSQGAPKQYYISKRCAKKEDCEKLRSKLTFSCTHINYEDWRCSECCQGDRCNYYVILSGSFTHANGMLIILGISVAVYNMFGR